MPGALPPSIRDPNGRGQGSGTSIQPVVFPLEHQHDLYWNMVWLFFSAFKRWRGATSDADEASEREKPGE